MISGDFEVEFCDKAKATPSITGTRPSLAS